MVDAMRAMGVVSSTTMRIGLARPIRSARSAATSAISSGSYLTSLNSVGATVPSERSVPVCIARRSDRGDRAGGLLGELHRGLALGERVVVHLGDRVDLVVGE